MNIDTHPLANLSFMRRPVSLRRTSALENDYSNGRKESRSRKSPVKSVRSSGIVFEKSEGRGESWVRLS